MMPKVIIGMGAGDRGTPRRSRELAVLFGTVTGLAPGLILPFVVALTLAPAESDAVLLGYTVFLFLNGVVAASVEASTLAEAAKRPTGRSPTSFLFRSSYPQKVLGTASIGALLVTCSFTALYGAGEPERYLEIAAPLAVTGVLASLSAVCTGVLLARGRTLIAVASSALRPLPALAYLTLVSQPSFHLIGACFVVGELIRLLAVAMCFYFLPGELSRKRDSGAWYFRGSLWQMLSTSFSQTSPAVDRLFLTHSLPGAVTAYEIADKIFFAGSQLVSNGLLLGRVSRWGDPKEIGAAATKKMVSRDALHLTIWAAAISLASLIVLFVLLEFQIVPSQWSVGLTWSLVALVGLPFAIVQFVVLRALISLQKQRTLLPLTALSVGSNAGFDVIFYNVIGAIGIVVASLCMRVVVCMSYVIVLRSSLNSIEANEVEGKRTTC